MVKKLVAGVGINSLRQQAAVTETSEDNGFLDEAFSNEREIVR
jgi:hypothetical protein